MLHRSNEIANATGLAGKMFLAIVALCLALVTCGAGAAHYAFAAETATADTATATATQSTSAQSAQATTSTSQSSQAAAAQASPTTGKAADAAAASENENTTLSTMKPSWSIFNLVATIITVAIWVVLLIAALVRRPAKERGNQDMAQAGASTTLFASDNNPSSPENRRLRALRQATLIPAAVAAATLTLTQDFGAQVLFFDWWSLLFGIIILTQVLCAGLSSTRKEENDDNSNPTITKTPAEAMA